MFPGNQREPIIISDGEEIQIDTTEKILDAMRSRPSLLFRLPVTSRQDDGGGTCPQQNVSSCVLSDEVGTGGKNELGGPFSPHSCKRDQKTKMNAPPKAT